LQFSVKVVVNTAVRGKAFCQVDAFDTCVNYTYDISFSRYLFTVFINTSSFAIAFLSVRHQQ
ncbi:unnamed protein product, partial [Leptidea sinapis]